MSLSDEPSGGDPEFTEDRLLGGRVRLRQSADGARAAIDPVFLAAAVAAEPNQQILDAGCGAGAAMLCLAARVPQCRIIGLELQRDLVRVAGDNALLNGMGDRLSVMVGDLLQPPPRLSPGSFDHVMANPPFIERGRGTEAPNPAKNAANMEGEAALGDWVSYWFGYRYKEHVAEMWPLSRYPEILPRGEAFVKKWGVPSIFIGRFFGPLRASVPLAAGIFEMSYWPFQIANFVSALVWSAVLLLSGDVMAKIAEWLWRAA